MKDLFSLGLPEFSHVDFPCGCGRTHVLNADFHYGNYKALLADLVRSRAPGGKIAVIAGNEYVFKVRQARRRSVGGGGLYARQRDPEKHL